jgi:hypothetical protein
MTLPQCLEWYRPWAIPLKAESGGCPEVIGRPFELAADIVSWLERAGKIPPVDVTDASSG